MPEYTVVPNSVYQKTEKTEIIMYLIHFSNRKLAKIGPNVVEKEAPNYK